MTRFRPCIDLHHGVVKQIVGGTLKDDETDLVVNFTSEHPPAYFAELYRADGLEGGHVIQLGPGNTAAAREALAAWPGGLQIGGGIHPRNAREWLDAGASHVIATSCLFSADGVFDWESLARLAGAAGSERLVVDLSCRSDGKGWRVAMNRWQTPTNLLLTAENLTAIAEHCAEFLIHAADVEGRCSGIDGDLVAWLGEHAPIPVTYAGGAASIRDLERVHTLSGGRVDLAIGSALDLFGGSGIRYTDCVYWNQHRHLSAPGNPNES